MGLLLFALFVPVYFYACKIKYEKSSVSAEDLHILETDHPKNKSSGDF